MLRFIILSISILTLISNYFIFNSYQYQTVIFNDTNKERLTFSISQFNEAIDQLKESLIFNPNNAYTKYLLSRNYIFLNDFKNAERYLEEIFEASPKIESSSALYLSVLEKNQNAIKLNNIYDKMIEIENKNIWLYYISALKNNTHLPLDKGLYNKALFFFKKNIDVL